MEERRRQGQTGYFLLLGNLVEHKADVIVNAANSSLLGGGGVDGAIHRAGGPSILQECKEIRRCQGECPPGRAVITGGGRLAARFVIHTVGPIWRGGGEDEESILRACYVNSLTLAREHSLRTVAFPSISTGAYRFPLPLAARIAQRAVLKEIGRDDHFTSVGFVLFDELTFEAYRAALSSIVPMPQSDMTGSA